MVFPLETKAQAGLEYLMTYGWALVLIATAVSVIVFVVSSPQTAVQFRSDDSLRIVLKGGTIDGQGAAEAVAQNITGGGITITSLETTGDFFGVSLNGTEAENISQTSPLEIKAGEEMVFDNMDYVGLGSVDATISLEYTDYAGLQREVSITATGTAVATADPISAQQAITGPGSHQGKYALSNDISFSSGNGIEINADNIKLNCAGHTISEESQNGTGIYFLEGSNSTAQNCEISNTLVGIDAFLGSGGHTISGNTVSDSGFGISVSIPDCVVSNNTINGASTGITSLGGENAYIANNTLTGISGFGIDIGGEEEVVRNNTISGNMETGITGVGFGGATIADNTITGSSTWGISLSMEGTSITNNTVSGSTEAGISIVGYNNTVSGNNASGSDTGISLSGGGFTLTNNTANNNETGISGVGDDAVLNGNTANGNGTGFEFGGGNITLSNNTANGNDTGVSIVGDATLSNNTANGNGTGIALFGDFTVNGNTVCSNTVIDIFCSESGSFTGTGNSATTKSEECTSIETSPC